MAVILQPLVGEATADGYFHPTLAGVANSVDFYPLPHTAPAHGCASIALGLGKSVVDGSAAVHFSLGDPSRPTRRSGTLGKHCTTEVAQRVVDRASALVSNSPTARERTRRHGVAPRRASLDRALDHLPVVGSVDDCRSRQNPNLNPIL